MNVSVLDALLAELRDSLRGQTLSRPRVAAAHAVAFDIAGKQNDRLWLDASRVTAGVYPLTAADAKELMAPGEAAGRSRQAVLLLRKHVVGRRLTDVRRIVGERTVVLEAGSVILALRLSGAPAATLAVDGIAVATWGEGREVWPLPEPDPEREHTWSSPVPLQPSLRLPHPFEACHDDDLAVPSAVTLGSAPDGAAGGLMLHPSSWSQAAALFLRARQRGLRFQHRRKTVLDEARRETRRLSRLHGHLVGDLATLPDTDGLRRSAEALLAFAGRGSPAATEVRIPDPYAPETLRSVTVDPRLSLAANADRLFDKARRIDVGRRRVEVRLEETAQTLRLAQEREGRALAARDLVDLEPVRPDEEAIGARAAAGPRHYLTSHGLSILVGRGAKENHRLTFGVARAEDLWLHAREAPGAHVILRDNEGRAVADDMREAAEVAAFFSEARGEAKVDVHVTRRKHVRPARGGAGRVHVGHSDTLRVLPRDPEGRLRRR